jgi:hypothetical protein
MAYIDFSYILFQRGDSSSSGSSSSSSSILLLALYLRLCPRLYPRIQRYLAMTVDFREA